MSIPEKGPRTPGKLVLNKSSGGYHWNLLASNGKVFATSEYYETRRAAVAGIGSIQKSAPGAPDMDAEEVATKRASKRTTRKRPQLRRAAERTTVTPMAFHRPARGWGVVVLRYPRSGVPRLAPAAGR